MSVARTVLKNVASSWVGLASQIVVTLLLTPYIIRMLGTEAYGVWLLLQGVVGYYGLVDMGLRAGMMQSITRRIVADDIDGVRRHIATAIPVLGVLSILVMIVAAVLSWVLPHFVEMSRETAETLWLVVLIQAAGTAVKLPITPYGAILVGLQRYDIANSISVLTRIMFAVATWFVLRSGGGLVGLSLVLMATNLCDGVIRFAVARCMLPGIRGSRISFDSREFREISNVGIWNFLIGISRQFIYFSDALVIGLLFSARAVAPYGIAASIVDYGMRLVMSASKVLFPTMAHLSRDGDVRVQRELYITATRMIIGISSTILIVGIAWIGPFLKLWLGESTENQVFHDQAPGIFAVLGLGFAFVGFQRAGVQLLLAKNRLRVVAILMGVEALLNLILSLVLGWYLGPIGVAAGTLISAAILSVFFHVPIHARTLEVPSIRLFITVLSRPAIYAILLTACIGTAKYLYPLPTTWNSFVLIAGVVTLAIVGMVSPTLLSAQQRAVGRDFFGRTLRARLQDGQRILGR